MTGATIVQQLAAFIAGTVAGRYPDEMRAAARLHVLDTIGIAVAASTLDTSLALRDYVTEQGGRPDATAIGVPGRLPSALAALVNGTLAHSLDYDDTHLPSIVHPSASVVPAVLAACEAAGADGATALAAIAAGIEVCARLGMAGYDPEGRDSVFFFRGQHATSICGAIAAAGAVAGATGLGEEQIAHAMAIAASMASGIIEGNRTGGTVKRIHCGWAAHSAVSAAGLAAHGFTGPPTVFEGHFGLFRAFLGDRAFPAAATDGLGERWELAQVSFKPFPANHYTHCGIDAAVELRRAGVRADEVERADLGVAAPTLPTIGQPIEVKRRPKTGYDAKFSAPYTIAAALLGGHGLGLGLDDFTDDLARGPERRQLMDRVWVHADPRCTEIYPDQFPAILHVRLRNGTGLRREVLTNLGSPQRPLTGPQLARKFEDNALTVLPAPVVSQVTDLIDRLDQLAEAGACLRPLAAPGPAGAGLAKGAAKGSAGQHPPAQPRPDPLHRGQQLGRGGGDHRLEPLGRPRHRDHADQLAGVPVDRGGDRCRAVIAFPHRHRVPVPARLGQAVPQPLRIGDRVAGQAVQLVLGDVFLLLGQGQRGEQRPGGRAGVQRVQPPDLDDHLDVPVRVHLVHVHPLPARPYRERHGLVDLCAQLGHLLADDALRVDPVQEDQAQRQDLRTWHVPVRDRVKFQEPVDPERREDAVHHGFGQAKTLGDLGHAQRARLGGGEQGQHGQRAFHALDAGEPSGLLTAARRRSRTGSPGREIRRGNSGFRHRSCPPRSMAPRMDTPSLLSPIASLFRRAAGLSPPGSSHGPYPGRNLSNCSPLSGMPSQLIVSTYLTCG
jgi:2-methylcitrate dehydratase PrpD